MNKADKINFKSYCWSIGTTSYRTDDFNASIERQLMLLKEFRRLPENKDKSWTGNNELQTRYYKFLKEKGFVSGDAPRPDKDAREKTSGLRDIGLLDDERNLTPAGEALLKITEAGDFSSDNLLEIPADSFLYFGQLLKASCEVGEKSVRPFIVFLYVISKVKYLSYDEFAYLLPLCVDKETTKRIAECIMLSRKGEMTYDDIIISTLMEMDNYQKALELLQSQEVTGELICEIGINRKSAAYDKPYYELYKILKDIVFLKKDSALKLYEATRKLTNTKVGSAWRKYFFAVSSRNAIAKNGLSSLNEVGILKAKTEEQFNESFFKIMHLFKAKATLSDYLDLNRRYFKLTDTVIFDDNSVTLDVLPKVYVLDIADEIINIAFEKTNLLADNVELKQIAACLEIDAHKLYHTLGKQIGQSVPDTKSAKRIVKDERYARFNKLIDKKFGKDTLIMLLTYFEERNDDEIRALVTDNADIPTIFEYILGVAWYVISGRKGDVLEYMNLSLEADLLPKTHAGGGEADIIWKYEKTKWYQEHTLLIEATLAERTNQRRMEMEPVSRHLGDYRLSHPNEEAYCIFVSTFLNINVISDFRARRFAEYYNAEGTDYVTGLKILPLQTSELKTLLKFEIRYPQIYKMLDRAYAESDPPKEWYEKNIINETAYYYGSME